MASVKSFEDLEVWQRARKFAHEIFELTLDGSFARDFSLRDQINKSAGSIMDNISEGFERGGNKEFILFLSYSKGSAGETRSQLYRALDRNHLSKDTFDRLKSEALHISKMIGRLMHTSNTPISKDQSFMNQKRSTAIQTPHIQLMMRIKKTLPLKQYFNHNTNFAPSKSNLKL